MKALILALSLALVASTTRAETITPDYLAENVPIIGTQLCIDRESNAQGRCYMFLTEEGVTYMVFIQYGNPVFVRKVVGDGYETVWTFIPGELL